MRVGVFGGSFDPVHLGHLILAEQCREQAQLDRVLFVPAPRPPHKLQGASVSFDDRVAMLRLATKQQPAFVVDTLEAERSGPSYTVDTLRELQHRDPGHAWFLIVGSDSVRDLGTWREPEEIANLANLLVVRRPGTEVVVPPGYFHSQVIDAPLIEIASTDIRERVAAGRTVRYLVAAEVAEYMHSRGLYQP
jgi:nicotinate-nucleotide adenylyltransferase